MFVMDSQASPCASILPARMGTELDEDDMHFGRIQGTRAMLQIAIEHRPAMQACCKASSRGKDYYAGYHVA